MFAEEKINIREFLFLVLQNSVLHKLKTNLWASRNCCDGDFQGYFEKIGKTALVAAEAVFARKERNMNNGKRRNPYATLALFTLAGATVINLYNKTKGAIKSGAKAVQKMFKKMGD